MHTTYWRQDPAYTRIRFRVRHMLITNVSGYFREARIRVSTPEDDFRRAEIDVEINVASLTTGVDMRDNHLRSAEFFEAEQHPVIRFKALGMEHLGADRFRIRGQLTIRGITKEQVLEARYTGKLTDIHGEERAGFELSASVDRFHFGLQWNGLLNSGTAVVGGQVKIEADIQMVKDQQLSGYGSQEAQLRAASLTLQSQLPPPERLRELTRNSFLFHRAKDNDLGGDFYWFGQVQHKIVVLVADGVGHGMEGSLKAMMGLSMATNVIAAQQDPHPRTILAGIHQQLSQMIANSTGINPELLVLEAAVAVIDPATCTLRVAGTGIQALYQRDTLEIDRLPSPKMALGSARLVPDEIPVTECTYTPGESLFLFTDGFSDQPGGDNNRKLGNPRVQEWVAATSFMDFDQAGAYLRSMFQRWLGTGEQVDDVTLIGIQL